ncbi:unnamed protein product, partial [Closterium sp. Yama58-4]
PYGGWLSRYRTVGVRFVVIWGVSSVECARDLLCSFFSPLHNGRVPVYPLKVVFMGPDPPSFAFKALLGFFKGKASYMQGQMDRPDDFDRVAARDALAIYLLANRSAEDPESEDTAQLIRGLVAHRSCRGRVRVVVELLRPQVEGRGAMWGEVGALELFCPDPTRFCLLARSCEVPAVSTLITNLFSSGPPLPPLRAAPHLNEYTQGQRMEAFPLLLPPAFHGMPFEALVEVIYRAYRVNSKTLSIDICLHETPDETTDETEDETTDETRPPHALSGSSRPLATPSIVHYGPRLHPLKKIVRSSSIFPASFGVGGEDGRQEGMTEGEQGAEEERQVVGGDGDGNRRAAGRGAADGATASLRKIFLFPRGHVIGPRDVGHVIAPDLATVEQISRAAHSLSAWEAGGRWGGMRRPYTGRGEGRDVEDPFEKVVDIHEEGGERGGEEKGENWKEEEKEDLEENWEERERPGGERKGGKGNLSQASSGVQSSAAPATGEVLVTSDGDHATPFRVPKGRPQAAKLLQLMGAACATWARASSAAWSAEALLTWRQISLERAGEGASGEEVVEGLGEEEGEEEEEEEEVGRRVGESGGSRASGEAEEGREDGGRRSSGERRSSGKNSSERSSSGKHSSRRRSMSEWLSEESLARQLFQAMRAAASQRASLLLSRSASSSTTRPAAASSTRPASASWPRGPSHVPLPHSSTQRGDEERLSRAGEAAEGGGESNECATEQHEQHDDEDKALMAKSRALARQLSRKVSSRAISRALSRAPSGALSRASSRSRSSTRFSRQPTLESPSAPALPAPQPLALVASVSAVLDWPPTRPSRRLSLSSRRASLSSRRSLPYPHSASLGSRSHTSTVAPKGVTRYTSAGGSSIDAPGVGVGASNRTEAGPGSNGARKVARSGHREAGLGSVDEAGTETEGEEAAWVGAAAASVLDTEPPALPARPHPSTLQRNRSKIAAHLQSRTLAAVDGVLPQAHVLVLMQSDCWPHSLHYFVSFLRRDTGAWEETSTGGKGGGEEEGGSFKEGAGERDDVLGGDEGGREVAEECVPIVFLRLQEPSEEQWGCVGHHQHVYFVRGSPISPMDLLRAGALSAAKIVIMASDTVASPITVGAVGEESDSSSASTAAAAVGAGIFAQDVENVQIAAAVDRLLSSHSHSASPSFFSSASSSSSSVQPDLHLTGTDTSVSSAHQQHPAPSAPYAHATHPHQFPHSNRVLCEVQHEESFQFLPPLSVLHGALRQWRVSRRTTLINHSLLLRCAPAFIDGRASCPAGLLFLIHGALLNRNLSTLADLLIAGGPIYAPHEAQALLTLHRQQQEQQEQQQQQGQQQRHQQQSTSPNTAATAPSNTLPTSSDSHSNPQHRSAPLRRELVLEEVPAEFVGGSFESLFLGLLQRYGQLAVGLYRCGGVGQGGPPVPYVATNPAADATVGRHDRVYVVR